MINGYEVLWDDGEREPWPYIYLLNALVPDEDPLILSDDDTDDDMTDTNSDSDDSDVDVIDKMMNKYDPEDREYREM